MQNHLFIGLGGQGGRSLAELRKVMEQRYRDRDHLTQLGAKWDFLSIDSSRDVWNTRKFWNYFGTDLRLAANQQFDMKSGTLGANLDSVSVDPTVSPWLGDRKFIASYLAADKGTPGANQRRRFGRFLFARNATNLRQTLSNKVDALTSGTSHECCFHIFATLAGGTGSGGLIDLTTTLRALYPNAAPESGFPIYLYLYVTSSEGKGADVGYFYQNQFAALCDLNALMAGRLHPTMLDAEHGGQPFNGGVPVTGALVASSLNSQNKNISIDGQIKVMAESCFERIYAYLSGNLAPNTQKSLTLEDLISTFGGEPTANPERSYRFGSLGMRRWEVPNEKIEELLALELVVASLRQMLYNNWQSGGTYTETALGANEGQVRQITAQLQGIIDARTLHGTAGGKLRKECQDTVDESLEGQIKKPARDNELALLESKVATFYEQHLGGTGVRAQIASVRALHNVNADDLVAAVDQALSQYWLEAAAPVGLVALIDCLTRFIDQLTASVNSGAIHQEAPGTLTRRMAARKDEWEKLTPLSRLVGKRTELLRAHADDLKARYGQMLDEQIGDSDLALKKSLIQPLQTLRAGYATAQTALLGLLRESKADLDTLDGDLRALSGLENAVRYEFDHVNLDGFRKTLRGDQGHLSAVATQLRGQIVPAGRTLRGLDADGAAETQDNLRNAAVGFARDIHSNLVTRGMVTPVLGSSLLERLQGRYRNDEQGLVTAAREFVERATSCLLLATGETSPATLSGGGPGIPPMPRRILVLGLPQHPFAERVERAILQAVPAGQGYIADRYFHGDPSQLRLFVCDYWMAARYMTVAHELASKYKAGADRQDVRYFCNIDPDGEQDRRPKLFLPTLEELQARLAADFWLGQKVGAIVEDQNGVSLISRTSEGDRAESIGTSVPTIRESANLTQMLKIDQGVTATTSTLPPARKRELLEAVKAEEKARQEQYGITSAEYREWQNMRPHLNLLLS